MRDAVIVEAVRTPVGKRGGGLSGLHSADISAVVLQALAERSGIDPGLVDDAPATCLHLLEAADGLVSLGQKDVFLKPASGRWRRLV